MKRSHDVFYLNENKNSIKQSFVEVADAIELKKFNSVADVGCATGVFPNYLSKRFDHAEVVGIEYLQPLLENARENFPHIPFLEGNVLDKTSITRKFGLGNVDILINPILMANDDTNFSIPEDNSKFQQLSS